MSGNLDHIRLRVSHDHYLLSKNHIHPLRTATVTDLSCSTLKLFIYLLRKLSTTVSLQLTLLVLVRCSTHEGPKAMGGSPGELSKDLVTQEKRKKGWRMNCDIGEAMEVLENEL